LLCLPLLILGASNARAQRMESTPTREVTPREGRAASVRESPVIDGRLNDAVWESGQLYTGFVQRESHEGDPVTE
jgi:hypothetical protein